MKTLQQRAKRMKYLQHKHRHIPQVFGWVTLDYLEELDQQQTYKERFANYGDKEKELVADNAYKMAEEAYRDIG